MIMYHGAKEAAMVSQHPAQYHLAQDLHDDDDNGEE